MRKIFVTLFLLAAFSTNLNAANSPAHVGYKLIGGPYGRGYSISQDAYNRGWDPIVDKGVATWKSNIYIGTSKLGMTQTSFHSTARFYHSTSYSNANATTTYYKSENSPPMTYSNLADYHHSNVTIYGTQMANDKRDAGYKQAVISHELGHVFGLADNNSNKNSIMCQAGAGRIAGFARPEDVNGVYAIY